MLADLGARWFEEVRTGDISYRSVMANPTIAGALRSSCWRWRASRA